MVTYLSALLCSISMSSGVWKAQVKALHTSEVWYAGVHWVSLLEGDLGRRGQCCSICHINVLLIEEVRKKHRGRKQGKEELVSDVMTAGEAWLVVVPGVDLQEAWEKLWGELIPKGFLHKHGGAEGLPAARATGQGICEGVPFQTISLSPPSGQWFCVSSSHRGTWIITQFSF